MRKMIVRILLIVFITSIVCVIGISYLSSSLTFISNQYEKKIHNYVENQTDAREISQYMYQMESLLWQHIISQDKSLCDKLEQEISQLQNQVEKLSDDIEKKLTNKKDKELLHGIMKDYNGFKNHVDVVYQLSRRNSTQSAQYYVSYTMSPYLDGLRDTLKVLNQNMNKQYQNAKKGLDKSIDVITIQKNICFITLVCNIGFCLFVVLFNIRKIISFQSGEQRAHQQKVMELQYKTIVGMANLIESRDGETGEHVKRTAAFVQMISKELASEGAYKDEVSDQFIENIWKAAPLHDIGKIKVPDAILQKPGKLTKEEFQVIQKHAEEGGNIITNTIGEIEDKGYLDMAHDVAMYHHEKWDGSGYPKGLHGQDIPLAARIMAVADVFDALISKRCYKDSMPVDKAYDIIESSAGGHFDPEIVKAFVRIRPQIEEYLHS